MLLSNFYAGVIQFIPVIAQIRDRRVALEITSGNFLLFERSNKCKSAFGIYESTT